MDQNSEKNETGAEEYEPNYSADEFDEIEEQDENEGKNFTILPPDHRLMFHRMNMKTQRRTMTQNSNQSESKSSSAVDAAGDTDATQGEETSSLNDVQGELREIEKFNSATTASPKLTSGDGDGGSTMSSVQTPGTDRPKSNGEGTKLAQTPAAAAGNKTKVILNRVDQKTRKCKSTSSVNLASIPRKRFTSRPVVKKSSNIQQRLDSAKEIEIKELMSKIRVLENKIHDLTAENRSLNTGYQRQAVALKKYEGIDSDLPRVLSTHQNELKYLNQTLRKTQTTCRKYESGMRNLNNKIIALEDHNSKLEKLVASDDLEERGKLQNEVNELNHQLEHAREKLKESIKQFDMVEKNHTRQINTMNTKLRESNRRVFDAEQELYRLTEIIRQKDRVISYLRMRSRNPGLEPPLHRKVMEKHNSNYKYFYHMEQSLDSVNHEFYCPSHSNSPSPSQSSQASYTSQTKSYKHTTHNHDATTPNLIEEDQLIRFIGSGKSSTTTFSEELTKRSRERNFDIPVTGDSEDDGEFQEMDMVQKIGQEDERSKLEEVMSFAASGGIQKYKYNMRKDSKEVRNDKQEEEYPVYTAKDDEFDQSDTPVFIQTSNHKPTVGSQMSHAKEFENITSTEALARFIGRKRGEEEEEGQVTYLGDGLHTFGFYDTNELDTGGVPSRKDGSGDAFNSSEYDNVPETFDGQTEDEEEYPNTNLESQELMKHPSILEEKFFTFASKPKHLGDGIETDDDGAIVSKHDSILKLFPSLDSVLARGDQKNLSPKSSKSLMASFHKNRPKGRRYGELTSAEINSRRESPMDKDETVECKGIPSPYASEILRKNQSQQEPKLQIKRLPLAKPKRFTGPIATNNERLKKQTSKHVPGKGTTVYSRL